MFFKRLIRGMLRAMATAVLLVAALIVTLNPSITDDLAPIPGAKREVYLARVAAGALQFGWPAI
jgi:hypothetical protein